VWPGDEDAGDYRLLGRGYIGHDALAVLDRQAWENGDDAYPWYEQRDPQSAFEPYGAHATAHNEPSRRRLVRHPGWLLATAAGLLIMAALAIPGLSGARPSKGSLRLAPAGLAAPVALAAPEVDASTATSEAPPVQEPQAVAPAPPTGPYDITGAPSLSVGQIEAVLKQYGSPAAGKGQALYELGVRYGIDPAYGLAFFVHESGCGTKGVARFTKSLGNIRWTQGFNNYEGYRSYDSWEQGMEDWYKLITELYINGWHLRTVDAIIPVYAPYGDNNNPPGYIASVKRMVDSWRGK
jgi:hypothetical protein